jgi:hypothetical protein
MTDQPENPQKEEIDAIKAIARTRDGLLLHRFLRRVLEGVVDIQEASALYAQNGRRSLARDLMRHMAEGLNDRHDSNDDAPILARAGQPVVVVGRSRRDPSRFPRADSYADHLNPDGSDPRAGPGSGDPPG